MTKNAATTTLVAASVCATGGLVFAQAEAAEAAGPERPNIICAVCGPSRTSLMTGCYPWDVGVHSWSDMLNQRGATIPQLLRANGYETCMVGRFDNVTTANWHKSDGLIGCFDYSLGTPSGGSGNYFKEAKRSPWFRNGKRWDRPVGAYSTDLITEFVVDFIERRDERDTSTVAGQPKPFFIYVSHYAPHWPRPAKEEDVARYRDIYRKKDRTALMQARLDYQIGEGLIPEGTTLPESALNAQNRQPTMAVRRLSGWPFTRRWSKASTAVSPTSWLR